ncbi:MAG TPA: GNAT family N-acetyltransferase [Clostridia bacterium]|nr:GNAT family N-acetyltransferase [Clostridia bacterium]
MIITRTCSDKDKSDMKKLWNELFNDSERFTDWLFDYRFLPEYCACTYDDDLLISGMHSYPMPLLIRGKEISSVMISGVATIDSYRKKGLMHSTFGHLMNELYDKGVFATTLKAVSLPVYYSLNHYGCTKSAYIHSNTQNNHISVADYIPTSSDTDKSDCRKVNIYSEISSLHNCYNIFTKNYSGIAIRDAQAFKRKMDDYLSDDAYAIAVFSNGKVSGYCIYFVDKEISAEEFIANDLFSARLLFKTLNVGRKKIALKTSQIIAKWITDKDINIQDQNSMGIVNIRQLLKTICNNSDYRVKITDSFFDKNNGVYLFNGEKTENNAHMEISSGQLMRLINGYMSLEELASSGNALIYDKIACVEISKMLPKQNCFIIDEY